MVFRGQLRTVDVGFREMFSKLQKLIIFFLRNLKKLTVIKQMLSIPARPCVQTSGEGEFLLSKFRPVRVFRQKLNFKVTKENI